MYFEEIEKTDVVVFKRKVENIFTIVIRGVAQKFMNKDEFICKNLISAYKTLIKDKRVIF